MIFFKINIQKQMWNLKIGITNNILCYLGEF